MNPTQVQPKKRAKRGRPLKFGRPAVPVTITLPADVINTLRGVDADLSRAVVSIAERRRPAGEERPLIEMVSLPGRQGLILVQPAVFRGIQGVSVIPLADGRAFLALEAGRGFPDFELAVIDRIESPETPAEELEPLRAVRSVLRSWRQQGVQFESRSIMVARREPAGTRARPIAAIAQVRDARS